MELSTVLASTTSAVAALALLNVIGVIAIFSVLTGADVTSHAEDPSEHL